MSAFSEITGIGPQRLAPGVLARAVHGERVTLSVLELEPGAEVPEHHHPNEQVGILLEGSLRFGIGDEIREIGPGATWRIDPDVPHAAVAGPEGAVAVEIFSPPRHDWAALGTLEPAPGRWP